MGVDAGNEDGTYLPSTPGLLSNAFIIHHVIRVDNC